MTKFQNVLVFLTECSASTGNQPLDYSFPGFSPTRPYEAREREGRKENLGTSLNRQCGLIDHVEIKQDV